MSALGTPNQIQPQDIGVSSSTQQAVVGSYAETSDGRGFRYVLAGGSDLAPGKLVQSSAQDTSNLQSLHIAAAAAAATSVTTTDSVTLAANQAAGGLLIVTRGPGLGTISRISGHPAAAAGTVVIQLEDKLPVALTTASVIDIPLSPYGSVIVSPTTATSGVVGVSQNGTITASQYGWIQTHGPAAVIVQGTVTVAEPIGANTTNTAGYAEAAGGTAGGTIQVIGYALTGIAGGEAGPVFLTID